MVRKRISEKEGEGETERGRCERKKHLREIGTKKKGENVT